MLGGSGEIRTRDQRIKSPLLYRLSYRPGKTEIIARSLCFPLGLRGLPLSPCTYKNVMSSPVWLLVGFWKNTP